MQMLHEKYIAFYLNIINSWYIEYRDDYNSQHTQKRVYENISCCTHKNMCVYKNISCCTNKNMCVYEDISCGAN